MRARSLCLAVSLTAIALASSPRAADPATKPTSVTGVVTVRQVDDFAGASRIEYVVRDHAGRRLRLELPPAERERLRTGDRVRAHGVLAGDRLHVASGSRGLEILARSEGTVAAARSVAAIVLDFDDDVVSCTDAAIASMIWTGEQSVDGLYREASNGNLSFPGDTDIDGQPDVFRVRLSGSVRTTCNPDAWAAAGETAVAGAGVDLSIFQHHIYVLPDDSGCSWAGLASIGCWGACEAWVRTCWLPDVVAHELGHNLGMRHASTDEDNNGIANCEYCDLSDPMGLGGFGWRHFNAPHKRQMGWLGSGEPVSVGTGGTIVLSSLDQNPALASFPQVFEIPVTGGSSYLLSYRRQEGYDGDLLDGYAEVTTVHRQAGTTGNTLLIARLDDGDTFEDEAAGITVTQLDNDGSTATVLVSTGEEPGPFPPVQSLRGRDGIGQVAVEWNPPAGSALEVESYRVYRDDVYVDETEDLYWIDRDAATGVTHTYDVTAWSEDRGEGAATGGIEIAPAAPPTGRDREFATRLRGPRTR